MTSNEEYCLYEVKPGDSLSAIAAHFGHITPTQLARINRLSVLGSGLPTVFPGQKILVPTTATARVTVPKHRPAPGAALRVTSVDSSFDGTSQHGSFLRSRSDYSGSSEDFEKRFVKVNAKRKLSSGEYIDGILLLTPDCLFFDATHNAATEDAQVDATVDPTTLACMDLTGESQEGEHTSSPLKAKLGICLSLKRICSMSTTRSSNAPSPVCSLSQSEQSAQVKNTEPENKKDLVSGPRDPSLTQSTLNGSPAKKAEEEANDSSVSEQSSENMDTPTDVDLPQPVTMTPEHSSAPGETIEAIPTRCNELPSDSMTSSITEAPPAVALLQLHLTEFAQKDAAAPREHCFVVTVDDIPAVFAFLLDLGVQSMEEKKPMVYPVSPINKEHKKSIDSTDSVSGHRSMIEEALEDLDSASLTPTTLGGDSGILTSDMLTELGENFPTHWIGANLRLIYRADLDGYSLGTVYRKSKGVEDGVLLLIRDTMHTVFGAILSEAPHCSQHFYGTGETCVFHWSPNFKRYDWTKKNYYFMLGSASSFQIGGQSGHNAIWIDEALKYGRSEPTDTFDNPVLSGCLPAFQVDIPLATEADVLRHDLQSPHLTDYCTESPGLDSVPFVIDTLEIWELVS